MLDGRITADSGTPGSGTPGGEPTGPARRAGRCYPPWPFGGFLLRCLMK
jgi:hypothetical protein